jgi:uncharacterized protein
MKLHLATPAGINLVTAQGEGYIEINRERHANSLLLLPDRVLPWTATHFAALTAADFNSLLEYRPSMVILGTGHRHCFPQPGLFRALLESGIGLEHMNTPAACRTYNILAAEGRQVAAALIVEPA